MLADHCPTCPFDIDVTKVFGSYIEQSIKNLTEMPLKLFIPMSLYRSDTDLEIDQKYWIQGLSGVENEEGLVIKAKTAKGGAACFASDLPEKGVWSVNVILPADRTQYLINYRYDQYEPLHFPLISIEQKEYELPKFLVSTLSTDAIREITSSVERLDLIEDKFGINISGVYASIQTIAKNKFLVRINFDISSNNGDALQYSFYIHATGYNKVGQAIGMDSAFIFQSDFLGFDSRSISFFTDQPLAKIRMFPKK